jgi:hypothetical protein
LRNKKLPKVPKITLELFGAVAKYATVEEIKKAA